MTAIPQKFLTGHVFLPQDDILIGQGVWDNYHPIFHRIGVGSGGVQPRWYPGVDVGGSLYMDPGAVIKSQSNELQGMTFGFEGAYFVVRVSGNIVFKLGALGAEFGGAITQPNSMPDYLPSRGGLSELLYPLFNDKTMIAQFNRPAFAGVDANGAFKTYRDMSSFILDFGTFTRGGSADVGLVPYVDRFLNYIKASGNQPRITYSFMRKKCRGLLIEPAATNLITKSAAIDTWSPAVNLTFAQEANALFATKGLNPPYRFTETALNTEHSATNDFQGAPAKALSLSFFYLAKTFTGTRRFTLFAGLADRTHLFGVDFEAKSGDAPVFSANRIVGNGTVSDVEIEPIGSGIYRIKMTGIINNQNPGTAVSLRTTFASLGDTANNSSLTFLPGGNTGGWAVVGDFQVEQNPFATSYIQTANTTMDRGADILTLNLNNFRFSPIEGLIEVGFRAATRLKDTTVLLSLTDDAGTTRVDYITTAQSAPVGNTPGTYTIGTVTYVNGAQTASVGNIATVTFTRSKFTIDYANLPSTLTKLVIDGSKGFFGAFSLISYE